MLPLPRIFLCSAVMASVLLSSGCAVVAVTGAAVSVATTAVGVGVSAASTVAGAGVSAVKAVTP